MNIISKIYNKIVFLIILILFLYASIFLISSVHDINRSVDEYIYKSLKKDKKLDDLEICEIFSCIAIKNKNKNKIIYYDKNDKTNPIFFQTVHHKNTQNLHIMDNFYFDFSLLAFSYKIDERYVYFDIRKDSKKNKTIMMLTLPLIVLFFTYVIFITIKDEKEEILIATAGNEALLANRSMINIAENIHHELNTPLEVIDNKLEKIRRSLNFYLSGQTKQKNKETKGSELLKLPNLEEDFEFIRNASEQIYTVLEKMKSFKHLRYSNGNKSIKNIIDGSFKIINLSNTNFEYKVDKKLSKFSLNGEVLKNADLLNIMLNHIKNSLEANSSKIFIILVEANAKRIKFRIIDNGNGIPPKAQKNIFKPNFSTKSVSDGIRGNGMYLNKHILKGAGGDIKLISTSNKGTTLEISLPIKERDKDKDNHKEGV